MARSRRKRRIKPLSNKFFFNIIVKISKSFLKIKSGRSTILQIEFKTTGFM